MATPRVFISSTCYDLKYIRENLRYFIRTLGYEPILSEDGSVFFNPLQHTHNACLTEIPNTQLFVLIIGGRYGGRYLNTDTSITNSEYREAIKLKIPVFALVESSVYNEHHLYTRNKNNNEIDLNKLKFPAVDSLKIFEFIDEVRSNTVNNALVPFRDFGDIESYLKQQWAGMMFDFLSNRSAAQKVTDTLSTLSEMNARIEMLSKQILVSVGTDDAKVDAALYEELIASECIRDLAFWNLRPTPTHVLLNKSFSSCARSMGAEIKFFGGAGDARSISIGGNTTISKGKFVRSSEGYSKLQERLKTILKESNIEVSAYIEKHPDITQAPDMPKDVPEPINSSEDDFCDNDNIDENDDFPF
jgi:hypothetical protein